MLRKRSLLIWLAAVTLFSVGIEPARACGHWDLVDWDMDRDGNIWLCWFNWLDWSLLYEYVGAVDSGGMILLHRPLEEVCLNYEEIRHVYR